jgi:hypothetical protein
MLGEWALLGHALWRGTILLGTQNVPLLPTDLPDLAALVKERQQIAAAVRARWIR